MTGEPNLARRVGRKHREVLWRHHRVLDSPIKFEDIVKIPLSHVHDNAEVSTLRDDDSAMGTTAVIRSELSAF